MARYFSNEEIKNLDPDFVDVLDQARRLSGVTFYLFHKESGPLKDRRDVDLKCEDDHARFHIVRSLMYSGLNRVGLEQSYVHVEYEKDPKNRLYLIK